VFLLSVRAEQSIATAALRVDAVRLSVRLSVAKMRTQKTVFFQKLSNLELWSLLTTNRKSYMTFTKNVFWTPNIQDGVGLHPPF